MISKNMQHTKSKWLGILGVSACALCCALPILGAVTGFTALVSMGVWLEKAGFIFLALAAAAFVGPQLVKLLRRPKALTACAAEGAASCATDCGCNPALETARQ